MKRFVFALFIISAECCSEKSFNNVTITASRTRFTVDKNDLIPITTIDGFLSRSEGLIEACRIDVYNQNVPTLFDDAIKDLPNLKELRLKHDEIVEIKPGAFNAVPLLDVVIISFNKIQHVQNGVFNQLNITELHLNHNLITHIDSTAFDSLPKLEYVELSHNKISNFDNNWFTNTPNVKYLSMSRNSLETIPASAFKNIKGKHTFPSGSEFGPHILLDNNKILEINLRAFESAIDFGYLDLSSNLINVFDESAFKPFPNIRTLILDSHLRPSLKS